MTNPETLEDSWLKANAELRMDATSDIFSPRARAIHKQRYEFAKQYCKDSSVLDAACGTGYGSAILASIARSVTGIDLSNEVITYAESHYGSERTSFEVSLVEYTRFKAKSFDVVVSFETVEHTLCPSAHMYEIARILKKEGTAIVSVPNAWGLTDHHFFDFTYDMLKNVLTPVFNVHEYWVQIAADHAGGGGKIIPYMGENLSDAYCILAVCKGPQPITAAPDLNRMMQEVYASAFDRHNKYRDLTYRANTNIFRRLANRAKYYIMPRT